MTLDDLQDRLLERVGEDRAANSTNRYYTDAEAATWLNAAQRLFVLLTLCLETTQSFTFSSNTAYYQMLTVFSDWLLPLRIRTSSGRITPARLSDFAALDTSWSVSPGDPVKYALLGFDLLAVYQQPLEDIAAQFTYARCPATLASPTDTPEIPEEYHPVLVDGAITLMRAKEGAGEWQKTLPGFDRFLNEASRLAEYVRARNREQGYDYAPFEISRFDRSRMLELMSPKVANG